MELVVHPLDRRITVTPGANLLDVLREHQVPVSYSCTAGRCGTCRCKVTRGDVLESGPEAKITNPGEGRFVLACMSTVTESCEIEIPEPDEVVIHPARIIKASVTAIEDMTHDIRRLRLRPAKPLEFSPGQYVNLQFTPDHVRPYSMAGLCSDGELEFHVRVVPDGRVSGYVANQLKVGDSVRVTGPLGTAYLRRKHEGPMLCVAGGTGLAPVLSIVRGALAAGMRNPIHLYFGVRSPQDIYGAQWLQALAERHANLNVQIVVAMGNEDASLRSGLVTDAVAADWNDFSGWRAYLCGAPPMVEAAAMMVKLRGIQAEHVYADAFYPAAS
ncbi:ferredoxin-NAD(P)+ reductase (naphthalene dioxygenase ferredoxin-specific) [Noviherbaspirillum humi]|uniref:Ferredoxin-NAD(P)+ reductase (Naphthalene dioxygenase ferredoxin-specific) n=1 Tax=Noviherbaspirillum humi TaxID=1688639 RepID=A0A239M688_9BURK|nr:FAD-binding oxidoreductase [Noviherbaspirillum humi]SNT38226.1 ferredoxin-NAD(P)+ reductase (naphthalene dioxygenase ferredoxin-specific) [Noviherbaspirillum humi]